MEAEAGFGLKAVRVIFSHCNFGEKELEAVKNLAAIVLEKRWKESGIIFELMNPLSLPKREGERKWNGYGK
ncbi:hypothetical protein KJ912_00235 [Patescibacteria group bacterium]|nr:hypothetical protein [Patescibacteria group bacterium]